VNFVFNTLSKDSFFFYSWLKIKIKCLIYSILILSNKKVIVKIILKSECLYYFSWTNNIFLLPLRFLTENVSISLKFDRDLSGVGLWYYNYWWFFFCELLDRHYTYIEWCQQHFLFNIFFNTHSLINLN